MRLSQDKEIIILLFGRKDWGSNKQWKKIDKRGIERIGFSSILPDLIYDLTFNITSVGSYLTKICFSGPIKPYETDLSASASNVLCCNILTTFWALLLKHFIR